MESSSADITSAGHVQHGPSHGSPIPALGLCRSCLEGSTRLPVPRASQDRQVPAPAQVKPAQKAPSSDRGSTAQRHPRPRTRGSCLPGTVPTASQTAVCTGPCAVAALTLPSQKHHCTGAGLQPPTCPFPPPAGPGAVWGRSHPPPSALAAWAEAALPAPVCHAAGAARSCQQPDEKGDCSAASRGRYTVSRRCGLDRGGMGQLWAQAQARSTPSSLAGDRRAARGPVPAADTQSTSVTCSLHSQAPHASHKAQHGQPAMRPAGLADHSLPSKSQQPPGAPSANTASTGAPSKGTAGGAAAGGWWGDGSALTPMPPQQGRHTSRCEPQVVVLLEMLMLLVESKGGSSLSQIETL